MYCRSHNWELATIESKQEDDELLKYFQEHGKVYFMYLTLVEFMNSHVISILIRIFR